MTGFAILTSVLASNASANAFREKSKKVQVAGSSVSVTPPRDWNQLSTKPGKHAETWTLDGQQLNGVTFYAAVEPGEPLVRERSKKREPLPSYEAPRFWLRYRNCWRQRIAPTEISGHFR